MNVQLGPMHAASFTTDPKHLGFTLARYKFVSKMLRGTERVLEVGCGDGTGTQVVWPAVGQLVGIDKDHPVPSLRHDILDRPFEAGGTFDAVYALDVLEHIDPINEDLALQHMCKVLRAPGVCIIGMPSAESQAYASPHSLAGHVNCKTEDGLRALMSEHFNNVFMFGMNDETLHCGFGPMCHYRLAIGVGKR